MTIITIRQPGYLPNVGFFKKIQASDIFVYLDDAQYAIRSWDNRNKIRNGNETSWLSVPVIHPHHKKLNEVEISYTKDWITNHVNLIESNYTKTPYFNNYWKEIKLILEKKWEKLVDFNIEFIEKCCNYLGIKTKFRRASELNSQGKKSELLLNICLEMKSCQYLSTIGAKEYLDKDKEMFESKNIEIIYHEYDHPKYKQKGKRFIEKLSILDLIFNENVNSKNYFNSKSKNIVI